MTSTQITPGRYSVRTTTLLNGKTGYCVMGANGTVCIAILETEGGYPQAEADAHRIALCLNGHDKLLSALKAVLPYAESELGSLHAAHSRDGGDCLEREVAACETAVEQAHEVLETLEGRPS